MKKRIFAVAAACCLMLVTGAFAQGGKKHGERQPRTAEQMARHRTDRLTERLKLSDEQSKELYTFSLEQIKAREAQDADRREMRKAENEKMKSLLTPEQYAEWQKMLEEQRANHKPGAGPKGPREDAKNGKPQK